MPFKVQYEIFDNKHAAADFQTYDYTMARIEWEERKRNPKGLMWRLEQTVMPDRVLDKHEEYVFLVYRVRKLTIYYRNNGQRTDDRNTLMKYVRKLDKWNRQTRNFLNTHNKVMDAETTKRFGFFVVVEEWRSAYYERQKFAKIDNYDRNVYREMTRKIRQFEKEIDSYIKQQMKLI